MLNKDTENLRDIIESADKISVFIGKFATADEFFKDTVFFDATMMNFIIMGESVSRISEEFQSKNPHIQWGKIKGLRNLIAHNYFGVDAEEIWQIANNDIPVLKKAIAALL